MRLPRSGFVQTGLWEAASHPTDLSIQIVDDKGRYRSLSGQQFKGKKNHELG
jgi:hypothetical protein